MRSWKIILSSAFREASQSGKDKNIPMQHNRGYKH